MEIKKSGYNPFGKFNYFELKDILPISTKLFNEVSICPIFNIEVETDGIEYATLTLVKGMEHITFKTPTAEASMNNPIQALGSKHTYLRRYLYLSCLDLVENDVVDATSGSEKEKKNEVVYATPLQVKTITEHKNELLDELKAREIKTVKDIKALTLEQASEIISKLKVEENANKETE